METRGERITPMSMSIQKPDSFGRSLSDGLESARPVTPIVPDPPFHANVFFRDSSQFFFFVLSLRSARRHLLALPQGLRMPYDVVCNTHDNNNVFRSAWT